MRNLFRFLVISLSILSLLSCAEKRVTLKETSFIQNINELLVRLSHYRAVEATVFVDYEGRGRKLKGDALLKISERSVLLRVYYMGFPAGQIVEEDGEIDSTVAIDKEKAREFINGLRKALLWWQGSFSVSEQEDEYVLVEDDRIVLVKKSDFTPTVQFLSLEGYQVKIIYENPKEVLAEGGTLIVFPTSINLHYRDMAVFAKIEKIKLRYE